MKKFVATAVTVALVLAFAPAVFADASPSGSALYAAKCKMCHGADGKGKTPVAGLSKSESEIATIIENGKAPKMPSYKGKLSPEEIKAVATFVKSLQ